MSHLLFFSSPHRSACSSFCSVFLFSNRELPDNFSFYLEILIRLATVFVGYSFEVCLASWLSCLNFRNWVAVNFRQWLFMCFWINIHICLKILLMNLWLEELYINIYLDHIKWNTNVTRIWIKQNAWYLSSLCIFLYIHPCEYAV